MAKKPKDAKYDDIYLRIDGDNCPDENIPWCDHKLTDLADGTSPKDAVNKQQLDAVAADKASISYVDSELALKADVTYVDSQVPGSTSELAEGLNLYYTDDRVDSRISSQKGIANGLAELDAGGKVPVSQLPSTIMEYQGSYDATGHSPALADGSGDNGDVYRVSVAGTHDFGSGPIALDVGDFLVYNGSIWEKSPAADGVISVNSQQGVVVLDTDDIAEASNLYYTNARVNSNSDPRYFKLDGSNSPSTNLSMANNKLMDVLDPASPQDAATKAYVDTGDLNKANNTLSNLASPTAINQDLRFGTDGVFRIGASTNRPRSLTLFGTGATAPSISMVSDSAVGTINAVTMQHFGNTTGRINNRYIRTRGSALAATPLLNNDEIAGFTFSTQDATGGAPGTERPCALINAQARENHVSGVALGTALRFWAVSSGSIVNTLRMNLQDNLEMVGTTKLIWLTDGGSDIGLSPTSGRPNNVYVKSRMACGSLGVGNTALASTLGSVVRRMEIFDQNGVSLGFIPVYNSIS